MYLVKKFTKRFLCGNMGETVLGIYDDPEEARQLILEEAERQKSIKYFTRKGKPLLTSRNGYPWFRDFKMVEGKDFIGISWRVSAPNTKHTDYYYTIINIEPNRLVGKI